MEGLDINLDENDGKKQSFYYIFHSPLDKVYNIFRTPNLLFNIFFQNKATLLDKKETLLDESGNEVAFVWNSQYQYKFIIEGVVNLPFFKAFTHRSTSHQPSTTDFIHTFSFFWNSTDKETIFKFTGEQEDTEKENVFLKSIMENKTEMCKSVENHLEKTLKNLEENESISIYRSIIDVSEFISDINNQKFFYPGKKITVKKLDENKVEINNEDENSSMVFLLSKNFESDDKKTFIFELQSSNCNLPKQKVLLIMVKMGDDQTFLIYKHVIMEFIPFDVLMSYSTMKKKVLRNIKEYLEKNNESKGE